MIHELISGLRAAGFAFVPGMEMRKALLTHGTLDDWPAFAGSWDDLGLDTYMADGGRYRKRRHATFAARPGAPIIREPHQPHYQSRDYNPVNGGIERWFQPVLPEVGSGPTMTTIVSTMRALNDDLAPNASWHIEVHQFRIEARANMAGKPTPEGRHRDGVDTVLVLLVNRRNIREGVTLVSSPDGRELGSFILAQPLDSALVDDLRVMHGVTPVAPEDPAVPGFRDVLVVTFRHRV